MDVKQMIALVEAGELDALETEWLGVIEAEAPAEDVGAVLAALVQADQLDTAETFAVMLLEDRKARVTPEALLPLVKAAASAVPMSDRLRAEAAELYRALHGDHPLFETMLKASGLLSGQSPRRALRTLDTCLTIEPGSYLANRFDHQVLRLTGYNDVFEAFEFTDPAGRPARHDPKELADEFDPVDDDDFRVLHQCRPDELGALLADDPAAVLVGICKSSSGATDANALRDMLVPTHLTKSDWSRWWGKARTAAKRHTQLSLSSDRPIRLSYHPAGRTLEEELARPAADAVMPLDKLAVLQQYARELKTRKRELDATFAGGIVEALAAQGRDFADRRPTDALAAALALDVAVGLDMPAPHESYPSAAAILAGVADPARTVADLDAPDLWPVALKALAQREDAHRHFVRLLRMAPAPLLDRVATHAGAEATAALAAEAMTQPTQHLQVCLWLWSGPAEPIADLPSRVELFRRLMTVLSDIDKDLDMDRNVKRDIRQVVRSALAASDYAAYRHMLDEIDDAVAATVLNLIQRTEGFSNTLLHDLLTLLRQTHYRLFLTEKVKPWENDNVVWTSEAGLHRREAELKHLTEIKMLENAEAIGKAAEHGDLSENSEWQFAIEERDLLRAQAARMQEELAKAKVIDPNALPASEVAIGSKVHLVRLSDGESLTVSLLGPWDSDLERDIYNYQTPLAATLLGCAVGDEVTLKLGGREEAYRIDRLASALEA
ncbi:MAG: GreA/GreB family elongation factor [Planctomycetota bacterium]